METASKPDKTKLSSDELTLHLIASGLVNLVNRIEDGKPLTLPYPKALQRGLNRLVTSCLREQRTPPQGIPDLFNWCRRPVSEWPLHLPEESYGTSDALLNGSAPTDFCEHWFCPSSDIEAELNEQHFFLNFVTVCKNANAAESYVAFRRLLIEKPVLTDLELVETSLAPVFERLTEQLKGAYTRASIAHAVDGSFYCCPVCDNLLLRTNDGKLICENERCRAKRKSRSDRKIPQKDGVLWLRREIRRFIMLPGQAELRLANRLKTLGLQVDLWPSFDLYDLRVTFPNGEAWAVDVKDWANPFLLGRSVKPIPQDSTWTQAYFVFPNERCQRRSGRSDYIRAFKNHCTILNKQTRAACEQNFITQVKRKLKQVKNA